MAREPRYEEDTVRPTTDDAARRQDGAPTDAHDGRTRDDRPAERPREESSNMPATAALLCGLGSLVFLFVFPPLGILLALAAVVLGIVGLTKASDRYTGGTGQAIAGLVTGAITLVLTALLIWGITTLFQNADFQEELQNQIEQIEEQTTG